MLSIERILTTHVGSLPRPDDICDLLRQKGEGRMPATGIFDQAVAEGVNAVVAQQKAAGIDIVSDGEFSKLGYATTPVGKCGDLAAAKGTLTMHQAALTITVFGHRIGNDITDRLTGFEDDSLRVPGADLAEFPAYAQKLGER